MDIETKRYDILSSCDNCSQPFPEIGAEIILNVRLKTTAEPSLIEEATIIAEFVEKLGQFYCHVSGPVRIGAREALSGNAHYETLRSYSSRTPIGELVISKVVNGV